MSNEEMVKEAVEEAKKNAQLENEETEEAVEDAEVEETEAAEETEDKKDKKLFKRKPKKDKKDEQIEDLTDKLTRQMAEFDNYRKRTEKEKTAMYEIGAKEIVEKKSYRLWITLKEVCRQFRKIRKRILL